MQAPGLPPLRYIYQLLRTNSPIPAGMGVSFRETLSASCCELSKCDDEVARLTLLLYSAQEKQRVVHVHHAVFATLASPIRRLPQEVLLEIFAIYSRCSDMPPPITGGMSRTESLDPRTNLLSMSSRRFVPIDTVSSSTHLGCGRILGSTAPAGANKSTLSDAPWSFPGNVVPLHLQLTRAYHKPELLAILRTYAERLGSLRITHLNSPETMREIDSALRGGLPLLHSLGLASHPSRSGTYFPRNLP
ncbi:hypothetical protein C8F01DRAFT_1266813 [Mycena amicta]|nr:hypothetical protein C8F01DRAFT_1266813 [Mycena amicta]